MTKVADLINQAQNLLNAGNIQGAYNAYQKAFEAAPNNTDALNGMGVISLQIGKLGLAEKFLSRAAELNKYEPLLQNNLALVKQRQGKDQEAVMAFNRAIELNPHYVQAMNNLGSLYINSGKFTEAALILENALQVKPDYANAHSNLGIALNKLERHEEAIAAFKEALKYSPSNPNTYASMAVTCNDLGEQEQAISYARKAIADGAQGQVLVNCYNAMGVAYRFKREPDEALKCFNRALEVNPNAINPHINSGHLFLDQGNLERGWEEYSWGLRRAEVQHYLQQFPQPLWHNETLSGKSITILAEQGVGDEILFASIFPDVIKETSECTIECDKRLLTLFSRSFPTGKFIERTNPPARELINNPSNFKASASQLAKHYRNDFSKFPDTPSYLSAAAERIEHWKQQLNALNDNIKIGVCWRSSLVTTVRSKGYSSLSDWNDILTIPGITFINLQYDECSKELSQVKDEMGVTIYDMGIDMKNDLDETAALTSALDYVISAPTAVAAMAGALGKKSLIVTVRNWAMLGTDHYPWYPAVQVTPWKPEDSWQDTLAHVAATVRHWKER